MPAPRTAVPGESVFARYAYPPNELGYCGPPGARALLDGAARPGRGEEIRRRARQFEGAWAYLELLAGAAGIADPLDPRVVSAYWVGGDLLDLVPPEALTAMAVNRFGGQPGVRDRLARQPGSAVAGASHAFHVFVVYPWVGLLGRGGDTARSVLDSCRIRWGTVLAVTGEEASVLVRPLEWDGRALGLGSPRPGSFRLAREALGFVQDLSPGETVTLHWDWICDRLEPGGAAELEDRTLRQLAAANAGLGGR